MTLLTGLLFTGLALIALMTYRVYDSLHRAELDAYRRLIRIHRELARQEPSPVRAHSEWTDATGFFTVGQDLLLEPVATVVTCPEVTPQPIHEACA